MPALDLALKFLLTLFLLYDFADEIELVRDVFFIVLWRNILEHPKISPVFPEPYFLFAWSLIFDLHFSVLIRDFHSTAVCFKLFGNFVGQFVADLAHLSKTFQ